MTHAAGRCSFLYWSLCFSLCSLSGVAVAAEDDSLQKVVDAGVLRVAAEPGTPPMLFKEGNRYDGFDYAIAKAVAKRIGVDDVIIVAGKYSESPPAASSPARPTSSSRATPPTIRSPASTGRRPTSTTASAWWSRKVAPSARPTTCAAR